MVEPLKTDLFKFVAVRPGQRVTEKETRNTVIRDPRASTPDGEILLARLARKLAPPGAALALWNKFDLSRLELLAEGYRALVRRYEQEDAVDDLPGGNELLREYGIDFVLDGGERALLELAWDALLTAERTGSDAGPRLEIPMAALRVLHFAQLLGEEANPPHTNVLDALHATPAIPIAFHNAFSIPVTGAPGSDAGNGGSEPGSSTRSLQLRELAQDLDATERLLDAVTNAPSFVTPAVKETTTENPGGWSHTEFALRTVPSLRSALTGQLSRDQASLLDRLRIAEEAPIPVAAQTLQAHLTKLNVQAFGLADDQEFQGLMMEHKGIAAVKPSKQPWPSIFELMDPGSEPDVDVSGRIVPLGIGDLKVVKQTLLAYVPGEVAHIENVLKGESKERKHRNLDRTETTLFSSQEETKETERDTQSTDRFELKRETEQTIKEDLSIKAGLNVTATFGPVVTTATGDLAYSTSKQDSMKSSSNFAREVVDRSVSKVQTRTRIERTTKTLNEVEEINTHGVNNAEGAGHIIGIYRWVDKHYRAQIYNYGVRLLLEFIVPEPSAFFRAAQLRRTSLVNAKPPEPFTNLKGNRLTASDINETNYFLYAGRYNAAGITPPPPQYTYIGISLAKDSIELGKSFGISSKEFIVPEGYQLNYYSGTVTAVWKNHVKLSLQVGRENYPIFNVNPGMGENIANAIVGVPDEITYITGSVPVSIAAYDVTSFGVNVQGICQRTTENFAKWRLQTFDKIYTAYQALQTAYDQKVTQAEAAAGIQIQGRNPAMNRTIEKTELKKLCITMMTGQHFKQFDAMSDPADKPDHYPEVDVYEALNEGPIVQFFEQAFEWEQMTYLFYPYFWGRKKNWVEVNQLSDPDPLFTHFLTAGQARVVVPVPMAYVKAVLYLLQSKETDLRKKIWRGGERPTLDSDLYVSIAEEMRNQTDDLAGAKPEGTPWEFTLPTTLVWLQPDSTLPSFI